jgi:hypothetical protein
MTQAAIATQVHQPLYIHRNFSTQITFHRKFGDLIAQLIHFRISEIFYFGGGVDSDSGAYFTRPSVTDTIDRSQCDYSVLMIWNVYPCNTSHATTLSFKKGIKKLPLEKEVCLTLT